MTWCRRATGMDKQQADDLLLLLDLQLRALDVDQALRDVLLTMRSLLEEVVRDLRL